MNKKIILLAILAIVGILGTSRLAYAANSILSISPATASKSAGTPFNVAVQIDPQGNKVCVVRGTLTFANLTCTSITMASGIMAAIAPTCANPSFILGIPKCTTTAQNIFIVSVKGNSVGQAKASLSITKAMGGPTGGALIDFTANGGTYNITAVPKPAPTTINPASCTPDWQIVPWGDCIGSQQTRTVADLNNCGIITDEPDTIQSCTPPALFDISAQPGFKTNNIANVFIWIAIFIFLVLIAALLYWAYKKRKKEKNY